MHTSGGIPQRRHRSLRAMVGPGHYRRSAPGDNGNHAPKDAADASQPVQGAVHPEGGQGAGEPVTGCRHLVPLILVGSQLLSSDFLHL